MTTSMNTMSARSIYPPKTCVCCGLAMRLSCGALLYGSQTQFYPRGRAPSASGVRRPAVTHFGIMPPMRAPVTESTNALSMANGTGRTAQSLWPEHSAIV